MIRFRIFTRSGVVVKKLLPGLIILAPGTLAAQLAAPLATTLREVVVDAGREQLVGFARIVLNPAGGLVLPQSMDGKLLFSMRMGNF